MLVAELNCYASCKGNRGHSGPITCKDLWTFFSLYNNLACSVCSCTEVAPETYIKEEGKHAKSNLEVTNFVPTIRFLKDKWHIYILMNPSTLCFSLHNMFSWYFKSPKMWTLSVRMGFTENPGSSYLFIWRISQRRTAGRKSLGQACEVRETLQLRYLLFSFVFTQKY